MPRRLLAGALLGGLIALPTSAADQPVTHITGDQTRTAFAKGLPLIENASFKVHASRREAPGTAEVHLRDTDIFYVLEGTATVITGGTAEGVKTVAPDEQRGTSIAGGTSNRLGKGDVFIVPNGTPHQFTEVSGPFLYYTVKVTSDGAMGAGLQPRGRR